jgi:hypothetical protein
MGKRILQLPSTNNPSLTGVTTVVMNGVTYQTSLDSIKTTFGSSGGTGTSGSSGTSGVGVSGTSGTSGTSGVGSSGTSGVDGSSGSSGTSGSSFLDSELNSIKFNVTPTGITHIDGQVFYDNVNQTLAVHLPGNVTLQIGQEEHIRVYNSNGYTIHNGESVYMSGSFNGHPEVSLAIASTYETSYTLGVSTQEILPNDYGYITFFGLIHDLNTNSWNVNDILYLSDSILGGLQNFQVSTHSSFNVKLGKVIVKDPVNGVIFIRQTALTKLSELGDVIVTNPTSDEVLRYNGQNWVNSSVTNR